MARGTELQIQSLREVRFSADVGWVIYRLKAWSSRLEQVCLECPIFFLQCLPKAGIGDFHG